MITLSPAKSRLETLAKLEHPHKTLIDQRQQPSSLGFVLSGSRDLLESHNAATAAQQRLIGSEAIETILAKLDDDGLEVNMFFVCVWESDVQIRYTEDINVYSSLSFEGIEVWIVINKDRDIYHRVISNQLIEFH